jgi:hypothetical protein
MSSTVFQRFKSFGLEKPVAEDEKVSDNEKTAEVNEKPAAAFKSDHPPSDGESEEFTAGAQDGVRNMEAITSVWSRNHLILAYIM